MFSLTIVFGPSPVPWTLLFKTEEAFNSARSAYQLSGPGSMLVLKDDYSQEAIVRVDDIHGVMFEDLNKSKMAQIDRGLHQMRTQIDANNAAKADPALMAAMRMNQAGPSVITPFGANGAFRQ